MNAENKQDLETLIDFPHVSRFQVVVMVFCALVAMLDGFDTQSIAFVAPEIAAAWHVDPSLFGPVFGSGLFGGLIGALIFGSAGDRFGRKPILILAILLFSVGSLITPATGSLSQLVAARFFTGLGLGGALPCFISITSEYAPKHLRATLVSLMFCGFPLGAVIGGAVSAHMIPALGWSSVFIVGGVLPLFLVPPLIVFLPESIRFLALRSDRDGVLKILKRMHIDGAWNGRFVSQPEAHRAPISSLFKDGRGLGTVLLWITLFCSLLLTYFLINWIPVIARRSGLGIQAAVLAVTALNLGAIIGCVVIGRIADRSNPAIAIACGYALGAAAIVLLGYSGQSAVMLCAVAFSVGALSIGAQMCAVALAAAFYETFLRATGIGWSMGVGRIGAIAGPVVGGALLAAGVGAGTLFVIAGLTSLAAALAVFAMGWFVLRVASPQRAPSPAINSRNPHAITNIDPAAGITSR